MEKWVAYHRVPFPCGLNGGMLPVFRANELSVGWRDTTDFSSTIGELHARCEKAGRDPHSIALSIFAWGDPEESVLSRYQELGIERVVLGAGRTNADVPEHVLPFLDRYASLIPKLA